MSEKHFEKLSDDQIKLVLYDFVEAFASDPGKALCALQAILLDEVTCKTRAAFLQELGQRDRGDCKEQPDLHTKSKDSFDAEIKSIVERGTFVAFQEGLLKPERLIALASDPDALREAHRKLMDRLNTSLSEFVWSVAPANDAFLSTSVRHGQDAAEQEEDSMPSATGRMFGGLASHAVFELFFRPNNLHQTIRERLLVEPYAKLALGAVCYHLLTEGADNRVFFEGGSTTALAACAMFHQWASDGKKLERSMDFVTNNALLLLPAGCIDGVKLRMVYANRHLNQKYAEWFPVSDEEIRKAIEEHEQCQTGRTNEVPHKARVRKAWTRLLRDAWCYDCLFLTASRFHLFFGPFVGSLDNAFFKNAYYTAPRLIVLLDASKVIDNGQLEKEWCEQKCYQVFDQRELAFTEMWLECVLGSQPNKALVDEKLRAAERNPCVRLGLQEAEVCVEDGRTIQIRRPDCWAEAVHVALRSHGDVRIYLSGTSRLHAGRRKFETWLEERIDEANQGFVRSRIPVRIRMHFWKPVSVAVNSAHNSLSLAAGSELNDPNAVTVPVWECRYELIDEKVPERSANVRQYGDQPIRHREV